MNGNGDSRVTPGLCSHASTTGTVVALSGMNDDRAYYVFSGDLNQMGIIEMALRDAGFPVVKSNVYPGFPKDAEATYIEGLRFVFTNRTEGWWSQERDLIKYNICTQAEFNQALGRTT